MKFISPFCKVASLLLLFGQASYGQQKLIKVGKDYVHHTSRVGGKCRDLRATYYPTFDKINKTLEGSASTSEKIRQIKQLEDQLPTRVDVSDTIIRSRFTRPTPETNIAALPTGVGYGSTQFYSLYDAMPGLRRQPAKLSPFWDVLYNTKEKDFLANLRVKRDGFYPWTIIYDCDTVMEIGDPKAPDGQRILLFQSDMDIDADGSDGERLSSPSDYGKDDQFQPEASYRWREAPRVENPFIQKWATRRDQAWDNAARLEAHLKVWDSIKPKYGHQIDEDILKVQKQLTKEKAEANYAAGRVRDITLDRHYVGELDPFIVVPHEWTEVTYKDSPFAPSVGDYALVFYGKKVYPCLFADQGPIMKIGEASFALARQIREDNPRLMERQITASFSPIYDLGVTYMIIPGTAKPKSSWGLPDYERWNRECAEIIKNLGGLADGFELHRWSKESLIRLKKNPKQAPNKKPSE